MPKLTRRGFIAASGAATLVRGAAPVVRSGSGRRILTLAYDKTLGMMRAIERVVPR